MANNDLYWTIPYAKKDIDAKNCYIGICTVKLADSMISATKLTQPALVSSLHLCMHEVPWNQILMQIKKP